MTWYDPVYAWFIRSALIGLFVLLVAVIAVSCSRQPARQIRLIKLAWVGCLISPWLGSIPGYPSVSVRWWTASATETIASPERPSPKPTPSEAAVVSTELVPRQPSHILPTHVVIDDSVSLPRPRQVAATPSSVTAERTESSWRRWIVLVYAAGICLTVAWWLAGIVGLSRVLRSARPADESCRQLLEQISGPRGDRVMLLVTDRIQRPFTFTWWRPVIVLPEQAAAGDDRWALQWCLAHEWAHVRRGDFRDWCFTGAMQLLLFYQPLFWWLRGQLRLSQDYLADAAAVGQSARPEDYAEFLTKQVTGGWRPALAGLGIGARKSELYRRVVMLVEDRRSLERKSPRLWNLVVTVAAVVLLAALPTLGGSPATVAEAPQQASPLDLVREFRFQTRPRHWVEFRNVSLRPGHETEVQIRHGQDGLGDGQETPQPATEVKSKGSPEAVAQDNVSVSSQWISNEGDTDEKAYRQGKAFRVRARVVGSTPLTGDSSVIARLGTRTKVPPLPVNADRGGGVRLEDPQASWSQEEHWIADPRTLQVKVDPVGRNRIRLEVSFENVWQKLGKSGQRTTLRRERCIVRTTQGHPMSRTGIMPLAISGGVHETEKIRIDWGRKDDGGTGPQLEFVVYWNRLAEPSVRVYPVADLVTVESEDGPLKRDFAPLVTLIESTIAPDTWESAGGSGRVARHHAAPSLVVKQTPAVHQQIAALLKRLRQVLNSK